MLASIAWALGLTTLLSLYRVLRGPTVFDRLTGLGLLATKTILLLLIMGFLSNAIDEFVDIALAYGLINFLGLLALSKYFESREAGV